MGAQKVTLAGGPGSRNGSGRRRGWRIRQTPKGGSGVQFSCTCIYHPHPATARLVVQLHDPFCGVRAHRVAASTKFEPSYASRR